MSDTLIALTLATALGCGLNAGVFYAFSSFVMPALRELPASQGIAAMQSINRWAVKAAFMLVFIGTALLSLGLGVWAALSLGEDWAPLALAGCAAYLVGVFGVTAVGNVPINNRVDQLDPESPDAAADWDEYAGKWTTLNHLRVVAPLAAAALLTLALLA